MQPFLNCFSLFRLKLQQNSKTSIIHYKHTKTSFSASAYSKMAEELSEEINTNASPISVSDPEVLESHRVENGLDIAVNMSDTNEGDGENIGGTVDVENGSAIEFKERRKRGRPRKEVADFGKQELLLLSDSLATKQKRGRGRPKGSGKWQTLAASFGGSAVRVAAGSNFTPYTMIIPTGEDISKMIWSVSQSQRASDSICVLSASGSVSIAEILKPGPLEGTVRYEGRFDIVSLSGSHIYTERGHGGRRVACLSVQLANPDGRLFGGVVVGLLIAAVPTQLVVASFRQNTRELPKARPDSRAVTSSVQIFLPNVEIRNVTNDPEENHASPLEVHDNSPQSCP